MLSLSHVFLCGVLLSVIDVSFAACNITLASYPALQGLVGSPLECLVTDILCLLQPLLSDVSNLVGTVLVVVYVLLQLLQAAESDVATLIRNLEDVIRQAVQNSAIRAIVARLLTRIPTFLGSVIRAVGQLLS